MLRDLATGQVARADRRTGTARSARSPGRRDGRSLLVTAGGHAGRAGVPRRCRDGQGHAPDRRRPCRQRPCRCPSGGAICTMNSVMAPDDFTASMPRARSTQLTDVNRDLLAELDPVTLREVQLHRRQRRQGLGHEAEAGRRDRQAADRLRRPRRAAGQLRQRLVLPLEPARCSRRPAMRVVSVDFHGSTGYGQAFTDAIQQQLGRLAARGPAEGPRLRHRATTRSSTPTMPARSAPPTAAT